MVEVASHLQVGSSFLLSLFYTVFSNNQLDLHAIVIMRLRLSCACLDTVIVWTVPSCLKHSPLRCTWMLQWKKKRKSYHHIFVFWCLFSLILCWSGSIQVLFRGKAFAASALTACVPRQCRSHYGMLTVDAPSSPTHFILLTATTWRVFGACYRLHRIVALFLNGVDDTF